MPTVRVDPHVKVLDERVRHRAKRHDLDAIVYAPHYTPWPSIVERAMAVSDAELTVIPAREVFTGSWRHRKHVLALDLDEPVPDFLTLEHTMARLREQEACVIAPHPGYLSMSLTPADVETYRAEIAAVEVYNPKFLPWHTRRARTLADRLELPAIASSYAHLCGTVGSVAIDLEVSRHDRAGIIEALRRGAVTAVSLPDRHERLRRSGAELAHLAWENSGIRIRRSLAGGPVATHPSAPIYQSLDDGP